MSIVAVCVIMLVDMYLVRIMSRLDMILGVIALEDT